MITAELVLVGTAELQHMLGLSRSRVFQLLVEEDFPAPYAVLRMGKVWDLERIRAWAAAAGRALQPLPPAWPHDASDGDAGSRYRRRNN